MSECARWSNEKKKSGGLEESAGGAEKRLCSTSVDMSAGGHFYSWPLFQANARELGCNLNGNCVYWFSEKGLNGYLGR